MQKLIVSRRKFLMLAGSGAAGLVAASVRGAEKKEPELDWHDVRDWGVEGKGWTDTVKYFDRLPARAEGKVPAPVWSLSRHSAGMLARFKAGSEIWIEHTVTSPSLALPHMPATGVSGIDLYADDPAGNWRWLSVSKPTAQTMKTQLISGVSPGEHTYTTYLPLYNGTESLRIGVPAGTPFTPIEPRKQRPLLFYGTSITHGACASRPGMPHPAILGRRLNRPVLNLGFSGNGKMEKEVGDFLLELDPAVYVIDCLPNMGGTQVEERAEPLVRQLRAARPQTPIVLVEDRTYANTPFLPDRQKRHEAKRTALRNAYESLNKAGFQKLYYIEGESLLGKDRDDTTDGSHPSDLGFFRQANAFEPVLKAALENS
jgi:lysophospholipase L1-like esterase